MRWVLIVLFVANVALSIAGFLLLPEEIAIQFGAEGEVNSWGSKRFSFAVSLGLEVFFLGLFLYTDRMVFWLPPKWVNMPNRAYWLRPERKEETGKKLNHLMWQFGIAFYLFFFVVGGLTLQANLSEPVRLEEGFFLCALGLFLGYTAFWCVRFYLAFRMPKCSSKEGDFS